MSRTRVRRRRLAALATGAILAGSWASPVAQALGGSAQPVPASSRSYVVRPGDTLWSIADHVAPEQDPRPIVDAIAGANGVDPGGIVPGQSLIIPTSA